MQATSPTRQRGGQSKQYIASVMFAVSNDQIATIRSNALSGPAAVFRQYLMCLLHNPPLSYIVAKQGRNFVVTYK